MQIEIKTNLFIYLMKYFLHSLSILFLLIIKKLINFKYIN